MQVRLVRQADAHERAPRALGAVHKRRRCRRRGCNTPQFLDKLKRVRDQHVIKRNSHSLAGLGKVDLSFVAVVAVVSQQQADRAELDLLGHPGRPVHGRPPTLHLDRHDLAVPLLDDVGLRDQPEPPRAQLDGLRLTEGRIVGLSHPTSAGVDGSVDVEPLDRVLAVLEA